MFDWIIEYYFFYFLNQNTCFGVLKNKTFFLIHFRNKDEVGPGKHVQALQWKLFYCLFSDGASFVDPFCYLCFMSVILSCLFLAALWSPAGKCLTSWLSCMWCFLVFLLFSHMVSWVRCDIWVCRFLIFDFFHTFLLGTQIHIVKVIDRLMLKLLSLQDALVVDAKLRHLFQGSCNLCRDQTCVFSRAYVNNCHWILPKDFLQR